MEVFFCSCGINFLKCCLKNQEQNGHQVRLGLACQWGRLSETVTWLSYFRDCVPTRNRMASVSAVCGVSARACGRKEGHTFTTRTSAGHEHAAPASHSECVHGSDCEWAQTCSNEGVSVFQ